MLEVLSLDSRIRDYVLLPISIVVFLQGMLRQYITEVLKGAPKPPKAKDVIQSDVLRRSMLLRNCIYSIPEETFLMRQTAFLEQLKHLIEELKPAETDTVEMPGQNMEDMTQMTDMMRMNVANILPNMISMAWVSFFFSGFVLVKLPFPLTNSFKAMLQQGVNIKHLDPSYVSSLSWYFLNLFGMRGLFSLVLGSGHAVNDTAMYQQMATMQGPKAPTMGDKQHAPYEAERVELEIAACDYSVVAGAEYRLLGRTPPKHHND